MAEQQVRVTAGISRSRAPRRHDVVRWAADEAAARGLPLHLVHAQEWPRGAPAHADQGHPAHPWAEHFRASGEAALQEALSTAQARQPDLAVTTELAAGRPVHVLRESAESAALMVIGSRHLTGLDEAFSGGGKGAALAGHLPCPLALIPQDTGATAVDAPVVVGVDGSVESQAAVALAFAEAAASGSTLVAVHVLKPRDAASPEFPQFSDLEMAEMTAGYRETYPDTALNLETLTGNPGIQLATAAREARCLVVGSRGRGGFRGMLLGSTGRDLIHRTSCPLLIAPAPHPR